MSRLNKIINSAVILLILLSSAIIAFGFNTNKVKAEQVELGVELVTKVNAQTDLSVKLHEGAEEDYHPHNRQWNGISTIISAGNNVFASWYTGGSREPSDDNYIVIAASKDNGKTWIDPFIIIDPPVKTQKVVVPIFYYNDIGELWLTFSHSAQGFMGMKFLNPSDKLENIIYEQPKKIGDVLNFCKPLVLNDGSIIYATTSQTNKKNTAIYRSTDHGNTFTYYSEVMSTTSGKEYNEAQIVELSDGGLMELCRIESGIDGGLERAYSDDKGKNWTIAKKNLDPPLISPGSRISIIRLKSGALCFITNRNLKSREDLTLFLSYDDGVTWTDSIVLDEGLSAYPDMYQAQDGNIYVVYDKGRYSENSIRVTVLTEEQIKTGLIANATLDKVIVTRANDEYTDIVSVNKAFKNYYEFSVGTTLEQIKENLPSKFIITCDNNEDYNLEGVWKVSNFKRNEAGIYTFNFITDLPKTTILDSHEMLKVRVKLTASEQNKQQIKIGCTARIEYLPLSLVPAFVAYLIKKLKRGEK